MKRLVLAVLAAVALSAAPASANSIVAFGLDFHYELGIGFKQGATPFPQPVQVLREAKLNGMTAITANGDLYMWDGNAGGQNGNGRQGVPEPVPNKILSGVVSAARGSIAATALGTVFTWGGNAYGSLGNGTHGTGTEESGSETAVTVPTPLVGITNAVQVAAVGASRYALLSDGTVDGWGEGAKGELGEPAEQFVSRPRKIAGLANIVQIAGAGTTKYEQTFFARRADGVVLSLGQSAAGQRGNGSEVTSGIPTPVKGLPPATAIAGSRKNGMATDATGQLYEWGQGRALGYKPTETCGPRHVPCAKVAHKVVGMTSVSSFGTGLSTSYAVKEGTLYSWGINEYGQLGNGSRTASLKPQLIMQGALKVDALEQGALVETNATTVAAPRIVATGGATSITVSWTGGVAGEKFNVSLQSTTEGLNERETKARSVVRTTAHTYTVTGLLPRKEYELGVGGATFGHSIVRAKTL